ncbi:ammonium transporter Rh type A-like [Daphnia pulicaria]|uniref:ammonium transporter Rh type A-like n=1 Tax=Daphnia pulicaria TaxID=35523 RepID=UPI001EECB1B2|nr:ammonium transporter Rh type A-like [Daphnia pulicaria]
MSMDDGQHSRRRRLMHFPCLLFLQAVLIVLFGFFVEYDSPAEPAVGGHKTPVSQEGAGNSSAAGKKTAEGASGHHASSDNDVNTLGHYYPMFQDVHVMIFIGFGFLMTFLKKYGYSAVALNFLIAAITLQWATLCQGFFHGLEGAGSIHVSITNLLNADFASATVLISFGAVLGVTTPFQLVVMSLIEIIIFAGNEHLGLEIYQVSDIGASMLVHVFGAYFGLAVSFVLRRDHSSDKEGPTYTSDTFAMIGTIFLWLFWPSFNSGLAEGDAQHRAVINTYYSLAACCVTAFALSSLVSKDNKFDMVHIQNSTLAGGVAIGTAADMMIHPWGAMVVGSVAGAISVLGYRFLTPAMNKKLAIHDTCGVHNLHGMPGVMAGIVGAITAAMATQEEYGHSLFRQFPARVPELNSTDFDQLKSQFPDMEPGLGRSATTQAAYQIYALLTTLALAIVGGLLTGILLKLPIFDQVPRHRLFDDELSWEVPEGEEHDEHQQAEHGRSKRMAPIAGSEPVMIPLMNR